MSVGFRSKKKAYDSLGYRTKKRKVEKEHKKRRTRIFLLTCIAILLLTPVVWTGSYRVLPWLSRRFFAGRTEPKQAFQGKQTLLFVGARKSGSNRSADSIVIAVYDPAKETLAGFNIPPDLFVEVPGQNFEKISESLLTGVNTAKATVRNLLGLPIDRYLVAPYWKQRSLLKESDYGALVEAAEDTDLTQAQRELLAEALSGLSTDGINVMALPSKQIMAGAETYSEPDKGEINRLMDVLWGKGEAIAKKRVKVIVLNGCGVPGIAGRAAEKLIEAGFQVVETKSALKFDYAKSHIIVYNNKTAEAERIRVLLGVGLLVARKMEQGVADVAVIIGADYAKKEQEAQRAETGKPGTSGAGVRQTDSTGTSR